LEFDYVRIHIGFTLDEDIEDPYCLYACRTAFETAFRRALSCRRADCTGCPQAGTCPYTEVFGQHLAQDPEAVKRHQKPPLPFVFRFPYLLPVPNGGSSFACSLTLFGNVAKHVAYFVAAVGLLLEGMQATLDKVELEAPGGGREPLAAGEQPALPLLSALDPTSSGPLAADRLTMRFLTPLKLTHEGRLVRRFSFAEIARVLMRRVSSLSYYYSGTDLPLDYRWLSQAATKVQTAASDCRLEIWSGRPAGLVGSTTFVGDLEPFHLLLQSGTAAHLGKGASFGFGTYQLEA